MQLFVMDAVLISQRSQVGAVEKYLRIHSLLARL